MPTAPATRDQLSATFAALADPTRRAILARLIEGEAPVTELARPFAMSLPAISKHLKTLERAGLIERSRHAQWRPCRIEAAPLKQVADWVESYRRLWGSASTASTTTSPRCSGQRRARNCRTTTWNAETARRRNPMATSDGERASWAGGLIVERVFEAPRALVWQAWTEPEHFRRWYGPSGMTTHTCEIDFRVGGRYLFGLGSPEGFDYWNTGVYRQIVAPERFVATMCLADKEGNVVPASHYGMPEGAPSVTLLTVILDDLGDGKTKLTLTQAGWPDAMAEGAGTGWNQAFDKLDAVFTAV